MNWELIYELKDLMVALRQTLDIYTVLMTQKEEVRKKLSGFEYSKAIDLFREIYPDNSDD